MTVHEVIEVTGLSRRTLHHYDAIGLLKPKRSADNAYRDYDESDLKRLEQIMLFKELGFALKDIRALLIAERETKQKMMLAHREILIKKRDRMERIIDLIDNRISGKQEVNFMAFDMRDIEQAKKQYEAEARQRWGDTDAYKQNTARTNQHTEADWQKIKAEADEIFSGFSALINKPDETKANALVEAWRAHISKYYYDCNDEILAGLADLYINDARFMKNIDQYGEGTAAVMSAAIKKVCEQKMNNG